MCMSWWEGVRVHGSPSAMQGVKQGCVLSSWLFNVFIYGQSYGRSEKEATGGVQLTATTVQMLNLQMAYIVMYMEKKDFYNMERNLAKIKVVMEKW